jgi:P-type Ca2+ transporter type 2C
MLAWHSVPISAVEDRAGVRLDLGLSSSEATQRLAQYGPNRLREERPTPFWRDFVEEVSEPMLLLLLGVGVLYVLFGRLVEAGFVWAIVLAIAVIEVLNERRADDAIAALHAVAEPQALVRRDGRSVQVAASEVVPGDVLLLEAGRRVAADARLMEDHSLLLDESALTGESIGVDKTADMVLPAAAALAERRNMLFAGTTVLRGRGTAVVTATGTHMELGRIAELAEQAEEGPTPLQEALNQLARWMIWVAAGFSAGIPLIGWLTGQPLVEMVVTGFALLFASVPEELPVIITLILAFGGYWLSRQGAVMRRRRAVEMLGAVSVIATDKTGTLTENRMRATKFWPATQTTRLLTVGVVCNDVAVDGLGAAGDPLDRALVEAAQARGIDVDALRAAHPLVDEYSFDSARQRMSVTVRRGRRLWVTVKGAPESVLDACTTVLVGDAAKPLTNARRAAVLRTLTGSGGLRVVALAEKESNAASLSQAEAEAKLIFLGLVGMQDPLRADVPEAIASCRAAGIRTVIVSGDHPETVGAIAGELGFPASDGVLTGQDLEMLSATAFRETVDQHSVFARTTPEQKLRIVRALTEAGHRVAATGDGINDAPALAAAEVGVAMGQTGTDVARQAADMVLMDDSFATLERSIRQCRGLFANLEKGIRYYLACKIALVASCLLAVVLAIPLPFVPMQIILIELLMDLAASAGFVAEPPEYDVMRRPPRDPRERVLNRHMIRTIFTAALGLFAAVTAAYLITWYGSHSAVRAQTVAFCTWLIGHVLLALTMRSHQPLLRVGLMSNRVIAGWGLGVAIVLVLIALVPAAQTFTYATTLHGLDWALVIGAAVTGTLWNEAAKWIGARRPIAVATVQQATPDSRREVVQV